MRMTEGNPLPSPEPRCENTITCLPVVTGSIAYYLGNKSETQTHEWTLYVRGPSGEDLSIVLEKVIFQLHPSFAQPTRELTEPPYEVTERGWGEFEAQIRLFWKDTSEQSILLTQPIKLYPSGTLINTTASTDNTSTTTTSVPVIAESYDEIVFTNPTESFFQLLSSIATAPTCQHLYSQQQHFPIYSDTEACQAMIQAQQILQEHVHQTKQNLIQLDHDLAQVEAALRIQQEEVRKKAARKAAIATTTTTSASTNTANTTGKTNTSTTSSSHKKPKTA